MPKVSIIIPTYNYGKFISKTLDSALNQTYKDFEIIVVDDGSTDNTSKIIKKFSKHKIKYIRHSKNLGFSAALNTGVKAASGKYLNFLSADDVLLKHFLKKQVQVLENRPEIVLVSSEVYFIDGEGKRIGKSSTGKGGLPYDAYPFLILGNYIYLVGVLVRKNTIKKFHLKLLQMPDWDMWLKAAKMGKFFHNPYYLSLYRKHSSSLTAEIKRNIQNIGAERKIVLEGNIKGQEPDNLKPFIPALFIDAKLFHNNFPLPLKKAQGLITLVISVLTSKILRKFIVRRIY